MKNVKLPEIGRLSQEQLTSIGDATVETYRFAGEELTGIVLDARDGSKKILRVELDLRRRFLGDQIVGAHFALEDYW